MESVKSYDEIMFNSLKAKLEYAQQESARFREEHQEACHLVAQMHAAAVGEVTGPNRGVVEDVEDLRLRAEDGSRDYDALMREREQVGNALGERTQERDEARLSRDQWKQEWELSERNRMDREADNVKLRDAALSQGMTPPPPTPENLHAHSYGVGWWEGLAAMKKSMGI